MPIGPRNSRRRGMIVGAAIASSRSKKRQAIATSEKVEQTPQSQSLEAIDNLSQIEKLAELRDKGILTEEEFSAKKKQLLGL